MAVNLEECDGWARLSSGYTESTSSIKSFGAIIENFGSEMATAEHGSYIDLVKFSIENRILSLRIYPNGRSDYPVGFVAFVLVNRGDESVKARFRYSSCGVTTQFGDEVIQPEATSSFSTLRRSFSHEVCRSGLIDGALHVKVEVSVTTKKEKNMVSGGLLVDTKDHINVHDFPMSDLLERCFSMKVSPDFKLTSNGTEFPCHKVFIASQSETLAGAVERWLPEGVMKVDEHKPEVIKNLIKYCYGQPIEEEVFKNNLFEFLEVGEKFDLPLLKLRTELAMISILNKETFIDILIAGDLYGGEKVKQAAFIFLSENKKIWEENMAEWKKMLKDKNGLLMEMVTVLTA